MRTRMIARWRRAALGGALALLLAVPLRAQQDGPPPPAPPQATEPQAAQPQRRQSAQVQTEMEPGIDATALNAPEEQETPPGASPETSVTLPDTADLEVVSKNSREGRAALRTVSVSGKLAFSPPPDLSVRASGLVTPEEMRGAGTLEASFEEKQMLAP